MSESKDPAGIGVPFLQGAPIPADLHALRRGRRPDAPAATPRFSPDLRRIRSRLPVGRADPGAPRSNSRFPTNPRRIRSRLIVGKGLALSAQHTVQQGNARANALHACGFAQGRRGSGQSLPEGASPFPTGERLRIRRTFLKIQPLLRGAPGRRALQRGLRIRQTYVIILRLLRGASGRRPLHGGCGFAEKS